MHRRKFLSTAGALVALPAISGGVNKTRTHDCLTIEPCSYQTRTLGEGEPIHQFIESAPAYSRLKLPAGVYQLDSVETPGNVILEGAGVQNTILRQKPNSSGSNFINFSNVSNVQISDLTIDVNGGNQPDQHAEGERGVQFKGGENGIAKNLEIIRASGHALKWYGWDLAVANNVYSHSPVIAVEHPRGRGAFQAGAYQSVTKNIFIHNCTVVGGERGISHRGDRCENILIANNRLIGLNNAKSRKNIEVAKTHDGFIVGNYLSADLSDAINIYVKYKSSNIDIIGNGFDGPADQQFNDIEITNNTVDVSTADNAPVSKQADVPHDGVDVRYEVDFNNPTFDLDLQYASDKRQLTIAGNGPTG